MDKLYLVNKRSGETSFECVSKLRKKLNIKKAGHTGTLDKFASGLLLILTGSWTKLVEYCMLFDKKYEAIFEFGTETNTLDVNGSVVKTGAIPSLDIINQNIKKFIGKISQTPPEYSSVHINGERAYKLALKGEDFYIKPRDISIYDIEVLDYNAPFLKLKIFCSKGTYIRSLARDLAKECGSVGYVRELKREAIGHFNLNEVEKFGDENGFYEISIFDFFKRSEIMNVSFLKKVYCEDFSTGKFLKKDFFENIREGLNSVFFEEKFLGVINCVDNKIFYKFVINYEKI